MLRQYLQNIYEISNRGDAREESFYGALEKLLLDFSISIKKKSTQITVLPKQTEAGNPDFRIWDGKFHITGYIEAKQPLIENLDQVETTEQLKRYLYTFPNIILTNFFEFRLYREGQLIDKVQISRPYLLTKLKTVPVVENEKEFYELLEKFFSFSQPQRFTAKSLAVDLAKRTRFLHEEVIIHQLDEEPKTGYLNGFYEAFKQTLNAGLSKAEFADLYSQTITYGLFAARTRCEGDFNRELAFNYIPRTIGILREVFQFISLGNVPKQMEWTIDEIANILNVADVGKILHEYFSNGKGSDPIIHFYETFLSEYNPSVRETRGVYYTPEPVVKYIVHSVHNLLQKKFNKPDGLASKNITVLDPAAGTLTFLAEATKQAVTEFQNKYGAGGKNKFIQEHILQNFYALELMMAPYAVGHLKMGFLLDELGYHLQENDRFKLYLTNTLEMEELAQINLPGMSAISEESHLAAKVKKEQPILVIVGNPPYSVSSLNKSAFIEKEMELYKKDVRSERNIQPLSDDYIKFIRFAQWKIEKTGFGVIGMITNNSYLSGLIHRGMRKRLLESFNEIYILNLHGSSRIGETSPDGSKDENIFDIMQGVTISIFVKHQKSDGLGKVFYQDVYGLREKKYNYLEKNNTDTTKWKKLTPAEPYYFFVQKDFAQSRRYNKFISVKDIFIENSSGVKTHRDHFVIGFSSDELKQRLRTFTSSLEDAIVKKALGLTDTTDFKLGNVRKILKDIKLQEFVRPYTYRPFDNRNICYKSELIDRDRYEIMKHFLKPNIGLCVTRQLAVEEFSHAFVTNTIADICCVSIRTKETGYIFPLYSYGHKKNPKRKTLKNVLLLFEPETEYETRTPNISKTLLDQLKIAYKKSPTPEQMFYYVYGVMYSTVYRKKYAEFLKIDFPKIPFTSDFKLFQKLSSLGEKLAGLHLLYSKLLNKPVSKFEGSGDSGIEKVTYDPKTKRVNINSSQYFSGVKSEVWEYQIGGYKVCKKWLKDRKSRKLSLDEVQTYCKIITALSYTIEIQNQVDKIYNDVEEKLLTHV